MRAWYNGKILHAIFGSYESDSGLGLSLALIFTLVLTFKLLNLKFYFWIFDTGSEAFNGRFEFNIFIVCRISSKIYMLVSLLKIMYTGKFPFL